MEQFCTVYYRWNYMSGEVAQWLAPRTTNHDVDGSSLTVTADDPLV